MEVVVLGRTNNLNRVPTSRALEVSHLPVSGTIGQDSVFTSSIFLFI